MASLIKVRDKNGNIIDIPILQGPRGQAGKITNVTASVSNTTGTPNVAVTLGGTAEERTINLAFSGLKGEKGAGEVESVNGKTGVVTLTASDVGALPDTTSIPDGTITGVTAGAGLSGGGTSGAVTLNHSNSVTAGSVGAAASPAHGGTFAIPKITYDAQGHITGATTVNITLPADNNTDTKVTQTVRTTNGSFPVLLRGTSAGTTTTTTTTTFGTKITANPSTGIVSATGFSGSGASLTSLAPANITAGTLGGKVQANATAAATLANAQVRDIIVSTTDLTADTSTLATGTVYLVYE